MGFTKSSIQVELIWATTPSNGIEKDFKKGVMWLRKVALNGEPAAQELLGLYYLRGEDVLEKDIIEAYAWSALAVENGADASRTRDEAQAELRPDDMEAAKTLLSRYRDEYKPKD